MTKFISLTTLFISGILCGSSFICSQPNIEWTTSIGGSEDEYAFCIKQTSDDGYIVGGSSKSADGDLDKNYGGLDVWVIKLDGLGNMEWKQNYGGSKDEELFEISETKDGGYIFAGYTNSSDGNVSDNNGDSDFWIVKINEIGSVEWQRTYGGTSFDIAYSIVETQDNGFVVVGDIRSFDLDIEQNNGDSDIWVLKLDGQGNLLWQNNFGGSNIERAISVRETEDGEFIAVGYSESEDGDLSDNYGREDFLFLKLNSNGNVLWHKVIGDVPHDILLSVEETNDNGFIACGYSDLKIKDRTFIRVFKLTDDGDLEWEFEYESTMNNFGYRIQPLVDGGYILCGIIQTIPGDYFDSMDGLLLKLDDEGELEWEKIFGGSMLDQITWVQATNDGGYIVSGTSESDDRDVDSNNGEMDMYIAKMKETMVSVNPMHPTNEIHVSPNPSKGSIAIVLPINETFNSLQIFNSTGQLILDQPNPQHHMYLDLLMPGLYFINIVGERPLPAKGFIID